MKVIFTIGLAVCGLILFALLNVVIRRWDAHIRSREDYDEDVDGKMNKKQRKEFEARKAREAELTKMPLVDVYREKPTRFWVITILGAAFGVTTALMYGVTAKSVILFLFFALLTTQAFIDMDTMELPFALNVMIFVLGIASIFLWTEISLKERLIGMVALSVPMFLIDLIIPNAFGFGDIKMMFAAGLLLGWKLTLVGFFAGAIIGALAGVILIASGKKSRKDHIPFGPSLCAGLAAAALFGGPLVDWYTNVIKTAFSHSTY